MALYTNFTLLYACDLEKLTSVLLMPHLWDSALNELSLNKTFEYEEIFQTYLSTQYSQNIALYNDLEKLLTSILFKPQL